MKLTDEEVLMRLRKKQCEMMSGFTNYCSPSIPDSYGKIDVLNKIMKIQKIIDDLSLKIALEKGEVYTTKFGQTVCSKEEFDYWNAIFNEIYFTEDVEKSRVYQYHFECQRNI